MTQIAQIFKHQLPILSICENLCLQSVDDLHFRLPPYYGCPPWATRLTFPFTMALSRGCSLPLILPCRAPCGSLPSGFPSRLGRVSPLFLLCMLTRCSAALRLPTLGYTFDFPFYHGAIARVFAPG